MRRLQHNRVAHDDGSHRHASHNCAGEIPRRNHRANAERNVHQAITLPGKLRRSFHLGHAQRFASVEFAEINGLGDVGIRLAPIFADFKNQPRAKFKATFANNIGHAKHKAGTLFRRATAPRGKGLQRRLHGWLDFRRTRILMQPHQLRRLGGIDGANFFGRLAVLATDDHVVFAAQFGANFIQRGAHLALILFFGEVDHRLDRVRTLVQN